MTAENGLDLPTHETLHDALGLRWSERTPERCVADVKITTEDGRLAATVVATLLRPSGGTA